MEPIGRVARPTIIATGSTGSATHTGVIMIKSLATVAGIVAIVGSLTACAPTTTTTPVASAPAPVATPAPLTFLPVGVVPPKVATVCDVYCEIAKRPGVATFGDWTIVSYKTSRDIASIVHIKAVVKYYGTSVAGSKCFNVSLDSGSSQVGSGMGCVSSVASGQKATADIMVFNAPSGAFNASVRFTTAF